MKRDQYNVHWKMNVHHQRLNHNKQPTLKTGILTTNPGIHGGVSSHTGLVYNFLKKWGVGPEVIYSTSRPSVLDNKARKITQAELSAQFDGAVRALPYMRLPFVWTITPAICALPALRKYNMLVCVCGSAHIAFSLALLQLPYIVWMGTLWEDELRSQIINGDNHAARLLRQPLYPLLAWQERFSLCRARLILTNSYHTTRRVTQRLPQAATRVRTIFIPVDTTYFHPAEQVRASPPYGDYLLLTARINDPRKNVILLLRAFAHLRAEFPSLRLVLAGEIPGESLRKQVTDLQLEEAVVFTGYVSRDELRQLYQGALLYVLPSNQEGLGLVLLEAMACGTPVVSTRSGGPEDIIEDGVVGRLVPLNDVPQLTNAIAGILQNPVQLHSMSEHCVNFVQQHHSLTAIEDQFYTAMQDAFPVFTATNL